MRKTEEHGPSPREFCRCEPCKRRKGEPHKMVVGRVRGYGETPATGWVGRSTDGDPDGYFLGVELETMAPPQSADYEWCDRHQWRTDQRASSAYLLRDVAAHNTQCYVRPPEGDPVTPSEAAALRRPKTFWLATHDSSVTGPEFASQPATLAWWYAHTDDITGMFRDLLHAGYRSHEGDAAGMHVNISTAAFGDIAPVEDPFALHYLRAAYEAARATSVARDAEYQAALTAYYEDTADEARANAYASARVLRSAARGERDIAFSTYDEATHPRRRGEKRSGAHAHLMRFLDLIYANKQWSRRMSQRTANSEHEWAKLDLLDRRARREQWAANALEGWNDSERYIALNRPDEDRFEFRLPRGTLRVDRFYKNLEWVHAMIEYTRNLDGDNDITCTPPKFMAWALRQPGYGYLRAFLVEKFAAQVERTPELREAVAV